MINCPHFGPCSGCVLNDPYSPPIWEEVKKFFGQEIELVTGSIVEWRTKARLAVRGKMEIGLFREGTHEVLPIPHCRIHHPAINQVVAMLSREQVSTYDERTRQGLLRYIQCFVELKSGKVQLVLVTRAKDPSITALAQKFSMLHSTWINVQPAPTNKIFGDEWIHVSGPEFVEQTLGGKTFHFHPGAFSQAHWTLFEQLAQDAVAMVPEGARLLEVYAGIGVMGVLASEKCTSVDLVESNPYAHLSFRPAEKVRYHLGDAKEAIALVQKADCYLLDPPRKGVDPALLKALRKGTIIYVSCDFTSFARDAELLIANGWRLTHGRGYLLFPGGNHVEILAQFRA